MMKENEIALLKYFIANENVSVEYYDGGKRYIIPSPAFLFDANFDPFAEYDDYMSICVDCFYQMQLGTPFLYCEIRSEYSVLPLEKISIPFDKTKQTPYHRAIMSLINACSKRVIALEISRNKYAITTALESLNNNKQYS